MTSKTKTKKAEKEVRKQSKEKTMTFAIEEVKVGEVKEFNGKYSELFQEYPLLSKEEEFDLAQVARNSRGKKKQAAREKLFHSNLRLVLKIANSFRTKTHLEFDDLIGAGVQGLMIAIDKYDPETYGTRFSTHAYSWVRVYIDRLIRDFRNDVYIPSNIIEKYYQYLRITEHSPDMNDGELLGTLRITDKTLKKLRTVTETRSLSLNVEISDDNSSTFHDIIGDPRVATPDLAIQEAEDSLVRNHVIRKSLEDLPMIERDVIKSRFLNKRKQTLEEIAGRKKLSKERIRQIEVKALARLKIKITKQMNAIGGI